MSEVVEETYYEGLWDCPNCDTTNKGSMMKCQACGGTRDEDVKFYMPDDAEEITDEADTVEDMQILARQRWRDRMTAMGLDPDSMPDGEGG